MMGALVILLALVLTGLLLWTFEQRRRRGHSGHHHHVAEPPRQDSDGPSHSGYAAEAVDGSPVTEAESGEAKKEPEVCCGLHAVCEKTGWGLPRDENDYYDDEELDRFRGRASDQYSEDEIEEFHEILVTLRPVEIMAWVNSLERREIVMPDEVREELMLILSEL